MIEWALRNPGYAFLLILAAIFVGGLVIESVFASISRPFTTRNRARIEEAKARTAEAKARRAALPDRPPTLARASDDEGDRPSRQAVPQGVVLGKG